MTDVSESKSVFLLGSLLVFWENHRTGFVLPPYGSVLHVTGTYQL